MTPEQRFFPARGDDELWVHDDVLGVQGEPPQCEFLRAMDGQASANIGQARGTVHGKNGGAGGSGNFWRRLPAGHLLLAVCCALLVHAAILGAVRMWLLPWWTITGPRLLSLELSGMPGGGGGLDGRAAGHGADAPGAAGRGGMDAPMGRMSDVLPLLGEASEPQTAAARLNPRPSAVGSPAPSRPLKAAPPAPAPKPAPSRSLVEHAVRPEAAAQPQPQKPSNPSETETSGADERETAGQSASGAETDVSGTGAGRDEAGAAGSGGDGIPAQGSGSGSGGGPGGEGRGPGGGEGGLLSFGAPGGPAVARMVMPEYPREARRLGKEGTVMLKISLDAAGEVAAVDVLQTPGHGLDEAAREAVLRSRFRPATAGGVPVACQAILPVHFKLR